MTFSPNQLLQAYLSKWWIPPLVPLVSLGLLLLNELWLNVPFVGYVLLLMVAVGGVGALVASIVHFVRGDKRSGLFSLLSLPVLAFASFYAIGFILFYGLFNDGPDNFGKDIVIPPGMEVTNPVDRFDEGAPAVSDAFTDSIVAAFAQGALTDLDPKVSTDLAALNEFATTNRARLIQHLSSSPKWHVTEERGKPYAYRRLTVRGRWLNSLNGFYGSFDVASSHGSHFQTRIVIGFDGPVFVEPFERKGITTSARIGSGDTAVRVVDDKAADQGQESYFVLRSQRAVVEVFEQSRIAARPATRLALVEVRRELEAALTSNGLASTNSSAFAQLGEPSIALANGMQGGIYHVRAFVNPGEAGRAYLKVFEATRNTPLSTGRIPERSTVRIGWSANPRELFRYQCEMTVYEGDWGNYYPARFELWFIPDTGGSERKLVEKIFRIEGWQR